MDFFEISLDSVPDLQTMQLDTFLLARLSFTGLATGDSLLLLAASALADEFGNSISAVVLSSSVEVAEPRVLGLLMIGLVALLAGRWAALSR